jgi:hypothetical protein
MSNVNINLNEGIGIRESISARSESGYLIIKNKQICSDILKISSPNEENLIDFLVSIHLVMEISLNTFFRTISLNEMQKRVSTRDVIKNLDGISFIDKAILFIYNSHFDFNGNLHDADKYHSVIGQLRNFSGPRNKLLHGHSISTIFGQNGENSHSETRGIITLDKMEEQVDLYRKIMEGLRFYFDCLKSSYTPSGKESIKRSYLDDSFLNKNETTIESGPLN